MEWRKKIWARQWPIVVYYGCRDREKARKTSVGIAGFNATI
jgi:hypothetical protein